MKRKLLATIVSLCAVLTFCLPVSAAEARSINLSTSSLRVQVGESRALRARLNPRDADSTIDWTSSDHSVAVVDGRGVVTGIRSGTAKITATTSNGRTATARVTVYNPSEDDDVDVRRVEINVDTLTVRVNQTRTLWALVTPSDSTDDSVVWTSSNAEIAAVDEEGIVTGISPGTATITATAHNGKSGTCVVTVPDRVLTGIELDTSNQSRTEAQIDGGELLSATSLRVAVENAVKEAGAGETATVTYTDKSTVSTAALRAAAYTAEYGGGTVRLRFITPSSDGTTTQGYLIIDPTGAPSTDLDLKLQVYTETSRTISVASSVRRHFGSGAQIIQLAHPGSYGMSVQVAARVNLSGLNTDSLKFYRFDSGTDTYIPLNTSYTVTTQGYLHFATNQGGTIVVTDR